MFDSDKCSYPCPRFIKGATDPNTGMVQCVTCWMWFLDDDPIEPDGPPDA